MQILKGSTFGFFQKSFPKNMNIKILKIYNINTFGETF
jgi:hypothetical protein